MSIFEKKFEQTKSIIINDERIKFDKARLEDGCILNLSTNDPLLAAVQMLENELNFSNNYNSGEKINFFFNNKLVAVVQSLSVDIYGKKKSDWDIPMMLSSFWDEISSEISLDPHNWFSKEEAIITKN